MTFNKRTYKEIKDKLSCIKDIKFLGGYLSVDIFTCITLDEIRMIQEHFSVKFDSVINFKTAIIMFKPSFRKKVGGKIEGAI